MEEPTLVFVNDARGRDAGGLELVVNFAVYGGREATPAEIERLGERLLTLVDEVEVICETRYRFDRERAATVYQVKVELPPGAAGAGDEIHAAVDEWATDCIAERGVMTP